VQIAYRIAGIAKVASETTSLLLMMRNSLTANLLVVGVIFGSLFSNYNTITTQKDIERVSILNYFCVHASTSIHSPPLRQKLNTSIKNELHIFHTAFGVRRVILQYVYILYRVCCMPLKLIVTHIINTKLN